jgi:hypothetical protein
MSLYEKIRKGLIFRVYKHILDAFGESTPDIPFFGLLFELPMNNSVMIEKFAILNEKFIVINSLFKS